MRCTCCHRDKPLEAFRLHVPDKYPPFRERVCRACRRSEDRRKQAFARALRAQSFADPLAARFLMLPRAMSGVERKA